MESTTNHVLVAIRSEFDAGRSLSESENLLDLTGNFEILVDEILLVIGRFTGALLLLPSIAVVADAIRKVRDQHTIIEVVLIGDTSSLWMLERKNRKSTGISLSYYGVETIPVARAELDSAFQQAITAFLEDLIALRPVQAWPDEALRILDDIILTWPSIARITRHPNAFGKTRNLA